MRKPAFYVVSSTVAILVLVAFVAMSIRPHIPTPIENKLFAEDSEFLSRAATQKIDWKKPTRDSFAQARRRDMPILLFIGNSHDPMARWLDRGTLMSPRIQALLARNFECIRVDTLEFPEFRNAFLPLSKVRFGITSGFQMLVIDPSGRIIDHIPTLVGLFPTDENLFARELVEARDRFEAVGLLHTDMEQAHNQDLAALMGSREMAVPPFEQYAAALRQSVYSGGGFSPYGPRSLTPEAWRWLLSTGQEGLLRDSLDPVLQSAVVDLVDGGFFIGARDNEWIEIETSKSAVVNANMLQLMAAAAVLLDAPVYRYLALRTFDSLLDEFFLENGVAAYRPSDQSDDRRSRRASFGVRRLLGTLSDKTDLAYAQVNLGLRVETNPPMIAKLANLDVFGDAARLEPVLDQLRSASDPPPSCQATGYADVTGYVVARMLEAGRLLGDRDRLTRAENAFRFVELCRRGDDVVHHVRPDFEGEGYAGDYLAYADAALQYYLSTGRYSVLQSGRRVLLRCLEKFDGTGLGTMKLAQDHGPPFPWTESLPELYDSGTPSAMSHAILLAGEYSRVFIQDKSFVRFANAAIGTFGLASFTLKERGAGFYCAASRAFDDEYFVTTGPEAQELADTIAAKQPFRLCVPAFGDIRADIQSRGPGVYLVRGATVRGPFDAKDALAKVSPYLGLSR